MLKETRRETVRTFLDEVLDKAGDHYNTPKSPLLADYVDFGTGRPPIGKAYYGGMDVISSDFAHQQNFLRTLHLYGKLYGDEAYCERAKAMYDYHFDNLLLDTGLFQWGGHYYIDLLTLKPNGEKGMVHELKNDFPFYSLMFESRGEKAEVFVKAFWNAHVYDFKDFEMGRHGKPSEEGIEGIWEREFGDPPPFQERAGLSFINTGNDLMLAAVKLFEKTGDEGAVLWGSRLYSMYVKCRHPKTGLGVYQFSKAKKREHTDDFTITLSFYGDRAERQLGPELGPDALEGNMLLSNHANSIYGLNPQIIALYYKYKTPQGGQMLKDTVDGLKAYAKYAYDAKANRFNAIMADGRNLNGFVPARPGYYKAQAFQPFAATGRFLLSYTQTALLAKDEELWEVGRKIAEGLGLGNIGDMDGENGRGAAVNMDNSCADAAAVMALLNIYREKGDEQILELADKIAQNIIETGVKDGYFVRSPEFSAYRQAFSGCNIDTQDPIAVLAVEAAKQGKWDIIPFAVY
ncbi:MAG: pectate lyase [Christensenellales bacterium]|jgi:pectate lyase